MSMTNSNRVQTGKQASTPSVPDGPVVRVALETLIPGDSPRVRGEDYAHARVLAESDAPLPPVTVHRETMRVVDGMHRLRAARLRGQTEIDVVYFDGGREDAFVLSVLANVTHGLPLTLEDRTTAATRLITEHPEWSDRRIASVTGLAAATVGGIRRRSTAQSARSDVRVGSDGRARPVNSAAGRRRAEELLRSRPEASLREVAREAGISPATAQDVRRRLADGQDVVPPGQLRDGGQGGRTAAPRTSPGPVTPIASGTVTGGNRPLRPVRGAGRGPSGTVTALPEGGPGRTAGRGRRPVSAVPDGHRAGLDRLTRDPAVRSSEAGRVLIRSLGIGVLGGPRSDRLAESVPAHCRELVAALADEAAGSWQNLAEKLRGMSAEDARAVGE